MARRNAYCCSRGPRGDGGPTGSRSVHGASIRTLRDVLRGGPNPCRSVCAPKSTPAFDTARGVDKQGDDGAAIPLKSSVIRRRAWTGPRKCVAPHLLPADVSLSIAIILQKAHVSRAPAWDERIVRNAVMNPDSQRLMGGAAPTVPWAGVAWVHPLGDVGPPIPAQPRVFRWSSRWAARIRSLPLASRHFRVAVSLELGSARLPHGSARPE
jgi:hypothetical protein